MTEATSYPSERARQGTSSRANAKATRCAVLFEACRGFVFSLPLPGLKPHAALSEKPGSKSVPLSG